MVSLGHVASTCIVGPRGEYNVSVLIDPHEPALPKKGVGELYIDFANVNRL
jgi:hypothetical protein